MPNQDLKSIIKSVLPSVVSIIVAKSIEEVEKDLPPELVPYFPVKEPLMEIPESEIDVHGHIKVGGGSGFVVDQAGLILTNRHVVLDPKAEYTVMTGDGKKYTAEVLARDALNDIAILKILAEGPNHNLTVLKLGDSSKLELGESVITFGNALGMFQNTVSAGIISGLSRSIRASASLKESQELYGLIQTDAAINQGNSGGPLVNMNGEVVGINTAVVVGAQNLGFAIPINLAKKDLTDYKRHGRITSPYLGVRYLTIDNDVQEKRALKYDYGALILPLSDRIIKKLKTTPVIPNSPAAKAGLKPGDIILELDGRKISLNEPLQEMLNKKFASDEIVLKLARGQKVFEIKLKLAEKK